MSIADLAALDKLCKTNKLTKLTLEIKTVTLISYEEYISFTFVDLCEESLDFYIMLFNCCHNKNLLKI